MVLPSHKIGKKEDKRMKLENIELRNKSLKEKISISPAQLISIEIRRFTTTCHTDILKSFNSGGDRFKPDDDVFYEYEVSIEYAKIEDNKVNFYSFEVDSQNEQEAETLYNQLMQYKNIMEANAIAVKNNK
jgi:hypothetical protein